MSTSWILSPSHPSSSMMVLAFEYCKSLDSHMLNDIMSMIPTCAITFFVLATRTSTHA